MLICGIDEAGRGPLAGDVYAAAVILAPECQTQHTILKDIKDSKLLSSKRRSLLFTEITRYALCYGIAHASVSEIDNMNILNATFLAMQRAFTNMIARLQHDTKNEELLIMVDGNQAPILTLNIDHIAAKIETVAVIKGDSKIPAISAASILAKVSRDKKMDELHLQYPQYNFTKHKGYATKEHVVAINQYGKIDGVHRFSFKVPRLHD